jgi:Fe-S-cluster containining protein
MSCPKTTPASGCLCDQCAALCCRYFALPIDNPKSARQYDDIRWYLCHENVVVFIEEKQWYLGIMSRCKHLQPDNRCGIYEKRPKVCREYTTDNCDYHGGEYDFEQLFTSAEQLEAYAKDVLRRRRRERARRKRQRVEPRSNGRPTVKANLRRARRRPRDKAPLGIMADVLPPIPRNGNPNGNVKLSLPILPV